MPASGLSTYREGSLHAALKAIYAGPHDRVEERVGGFIVDVARADELIEIQTGSFESAARKIRRLVGDHRMLLVHPVAVERWLIHVDSDGAIIARRRSPRRGTALDLFEELVAFPELVAEPNFDLELALIREEEIRGPIEEGKRYRYPRTWRRLDRRLIEVVGLVRVSSPGDLLGLLPPLPDQFTSADIAAATGCTKRLSMRAAYCLQKAGASTCIGRLGRMQLYRAAVPAGVAAAVEQVTGQ